MWLTIFPVPAVLSVHPHHCAAVESEKCLSSYAYQLAVTCRTFSSSSSPSISTQRCERHQYSLVYPHTYLFTDTATTHFKSSPSPTPARLWYSLSDAPWTTAMSLTTHLGWILFSQSLWHKHICSSIRWTGLERFIWKSEGLKIILWLWELCVILKPSVEYDFLWDLPKGK